LPSRAPPHLRSAISWAERSQARQRWPVRLRVRHRGMTARPERRARTTAAALQRGAPNGTSAPIGGVLSGRPRRVVVREYSPSALRAPWPLLSAAEPASTEETVALDLPPRPELLQSSGPSQLVYLAYDRLHFLVVA
jgi:hypothetical protein